MAEMATIATVLSIAGSAMSFMGTMQQGKAEQQSANYEAARLDEKAGQERAVAQRNAIEQRRQSRILASRAQAVGAAGGGSALDPTVVNSIAAIEAEGKLGALTALYEGEERARGNEGAANLRRYEGKNARRAATTSAYSSLASGIGGTFYSKYGSGMGDRTLPWQTPGNVNPAGGYY